MTVGPVLEALEEHVVLLRLLQEVGSHDDLTVRIGSENQVEGLAGSAVVTTGYGPHSLSVAHIGVLGPTRMDYRAPWVPVRCSGALPGPDSEPVRKTMAADYYQTLRVSRDATPEEIKRAYRKLARELHPDVNPDASTHEKFKDVTAAYEVLSDPRKRQMYDLGHDPRAGRDWRWRGRFSALRTCSRI